MDVAHSLINSKVRVNALQVSIYSSDGVYEGLTHTTGPTFVCCCDAP